MRSTAASPAGISRTFTGSSSLAIAGLVSPTTSSVPEYEWEDQDALKVAKEVALGEEFGFTFDFGDYWRHHCRVLPEKLDPREESGPGPLSRDPAAVWGWGDIPDQYGRRSFEGTD